MHIHSDSEVGPVDPVPHGDPLVKVTTVPARR